MATTALYTRVDVMRHLQEWAQDGSTIDQVVLRKIYRAIEAAYREVINARSWSYYVTRGRLDTVEQFTDSTITYDNEGGTFDRMVTLTSGTWPTWAKFGTLSINGVEYAVATRESATVLTLSVNSHPTEDISTASSYYLWRDTYPLPVNCRSLGTIKDAQRNQVLNWFEPNDFVAMRLYGTVPSYPHSFSILSDENYVGTNAIKLFPPPTTEIHYDYMYMRTGRQFSVAQYNTGTVTTSGTTVTLTNGTFAQNMIGCVIRFGNDGNTLPSGTEGANPYVAQRMLLSYNSGSVMLMDQPLDSEVTGVRYEVSDPIDIESGAMYTAFLRRCEYEVTTMMRREDTAEKLAESNMAMTLAMEADKRNFDRLPYPSKYWRRIPVYWDITNTMA